MKYSSHNLNGPMGSWSHGAQLGLLWNKHKTRENRVLHLQRSELGLISNAPGWETAKVPWRPSQDALPISTPSVSGTFSRFLLFSSLHHSYTTKNTARRRGQTARHIAERLGWCGSWTRFFLVLLIISSCLRNWVPRFIELFQ